MILRDLAGLNNARGAYLSCPPGYGGQFPGRVGLDSFPGVNPSTITVCAKKRVRIYNVTFGENAHLRVYAIAFRSYGSIEYYFAAQCLGSDHNWKNYPHVYKSERRRRGPGGVCIDPKLYDAAWMACKIEQYFVAIDIIATALTHSEIVDSLVTGHALPFTCPICGRDGNTRYMCGLYVDGIRRGVCPRCYELGGYS